ncbi:UvrD-helicase domain-containing protein [Mangrovivirga sp. M17]|uniref:DNA 3'-5' helicase n=1 Tax=Mangrovivirga halotolerans TaxID=2993936 RepID=A0ABT3RLK4_9BACT|nr:UvrD-helicase domain-containing protein [Mangrovivirga halotolerans]MCX2742440.1 UvrD-helicase domain-containing protein [Mangrovivirga halotolerans]
MDKFLTIYKASAGSGKTFTLTFNYLKLLLRSSDPFQYRRILAITFTNKATQEMKSRIVKSLHELASGKDTVFRTMLAEQLQLSNEEITKRSKRSLSNILHDYSHFSVSTIDAFVQRVIRSFSRELGHKGNYGIELDVNRVMDTLVRRQISKTGKDKFLTSWINDLIKDRIADSKSIRITSMLRELGQELFSEQYVLLTQDIPDKINEDTFSEVKEKLIAIVELFENELHKIGESAEVKCINNGFELVDFSYGKAGGAYFLKKIQLPVNFPDDYEIKKRPLDAIENYEILLKKTDLSNEIKVSLARDIISPALNEAIGYIRNNYSIYVTAKLILKSLHAFGLINRLEEALSDYREEEEVMMISDASQLLNEIVTKTHAPFIYEKIGTQYDHFLIDEFQDTSTLQWQNLEPLISDSIASGRENLLVGDVKQSIYRFRGGNWKLMHSHLYKVFGDMAKTVTLGNNFRSKKEIIDYNNALFPALSDLLANNLYAQVSEYTSSEDILNEVRSINSIYQDVTQKWSEKSEKEGGYVQFRFFEGDKDAYGNQKSEEDELKFEEKVLENLPSLLEKVQDQGYDLSEMAFLVRTKSQGTKIADYLRSFANSEKAKAEYSYRAASSEAFKLAESASLNLFFYLMKWLLYEKDTFSLYKAVYNWKERLNDEETGLIYEKVTRENLTKDLIDKLPDEFIQGYGSWYHKDLYSVYQNFKKIFKIENYPGEFAYLSAFEDELLNFIQRRYSLSGLGALQAICEWWDDKGGDVKIDSSGSTGAANILTVHKSKGLEFKVVVMPFMKGEFHNSSGFIKNYLWLAGKPEMPEELPYYPLEITSRMKESLYAENYALEDTLSFIDTYNMIYVAMTRAEDAMIIFSEHSNPKNGQIKKIEQLFTAFFEDNSDSLPGKYDSELMIYEQGEWAEVKKDFRKSKSTTLKPLPVSEWNNKLNIRQSRDLIFEKNEEKLEKINLGITAHNFLARLQNLDDLDKQLLEFSRETGVNNDQKQRIKEMVENALSDIQVRSWFESGKKVISERALLLPDGTQVRPDKLLFDDERNEVEIIDFKTGEEKKKDENQVKEYARFLNQAGYTVSKVALCYIGESVKIKEVK